MDFSKIQLQSTAVHLLFITLNKFLDGNVKFGKYHYDETGFWVDFFTSEKIGVNDFSKLEKEFLKQSSNNLKFEFKKIDFELNSYQKKLSEELKDPLGIYFGTNYKNISLQTELIKTNTIKFIKLNSIGGIEFEKENWTRINAACFAQKEEYDKYLIEQEELKKHDHRLIGANLELFTFDDLIGKGFPIWLPNGQIVKREIKRFLWSVFEKAKFNFVDTPVLGSKELYITSGHYAHYSENNFPVINVDQESFMLRPMTCPHHIVLYKTKTHSYKDLPVYYCEDSKLHRYETSGGLMGLERVRAMELFDCHIVAKESEIEAVIFKLINILGTIYEKFNFEIDRVDLSLRDKKDKEKFYDDDSMWNAAESQLKQIVKKSKYDFIEMEGEAAFYGPKIDFQFKNTLNKIVTISTIQLDFLLPKRFEMDYVDENNTKQTPVLIHFGPIGTYERFISALLSQTAGVLPFWLSPKQIQILPINAEYHLEYAKKVYTLLDQKGYRVELENSNERFNKKIRNAAIKKIPIVLIIGDNEIKNKQITYRQYGQEENKTIALSELSQFLENL